MWSWICGPPKTSNAPIYPSASRVQRSTTGVTAFHLPHSTAVEIKYFEKRWKWFWNSQPGKCLYQAEFVELWTLFTDVLWKFVGSSLLEWECYRRQWPLEHAADAFDLDLYYIEKHASARQMILWLYDDDRTLHPQVDSVLFV